MTNENVERKIKMRKTPDFSFVTKIFLVYSKLNMKRYLKSYINSGDCYLWANLVYHLHSEITLCIADAHAFVRYKNRFYDSDKPQGIKNWENLPTIKNSNFKNNGIPGYKEFKTQKSFADYWGFGKNHHLVILKTVGEPNEQN